MKTQKCFAVMFFISLVIITSCTKEVKNNWDDFARDFVETYFKQNPDWAVYYGRHDYDGQISDYSDKGIQERLAWYKNQKLLAQQFKDADLSEEQRIEKQNLLRVIDQNLFISETVRWPYNNAYYLSWQLDPSLYLEKDYAPLEQRMKGYVKYLQSMQITVKQIQNNFAIEPTLPSSHLIIAKNIFIGFADFMKTDAPKGFENVKDKKLWQDFNRESYETINTLNEFVKWLDSQIPNAKDNFAIGAEKYSQMLYATDRLSIPLSELKKMAEDDLERNLTALKKACEKYLPNKTIEECIQIVQADKPKIGCIEEAGEQLPFLEKFLKENNIVSIPNYTKLFVRESPPFMRSSRAFMSPPMPYDKEMVGIYYITPPDPKWTKEVRDKYIYSNNVLLFNSTHEIWPGHFLQHIYSNNNKSLIARIFWNYTTSEGWAHYSEEMMYEKGLGNYAPDYEIAMRLAALSRNVRFIVSIKMHTAGMSVDEAEQMFIKYAHYDKGSARQNAFRGTYDPQYYAYTLGKILIRRLKDKWMTKTGINNLNEFHTKFLSYGNLPIPLIEKDMLR